MFLIFNSKGFQLYSSFFQLLPTYLFHFLGLLVANMWNLMLVPINIVSLQPEQFPAFYLPVKWDTCCTSQSIANPMLCRPVWNLSSYDECFQNCCEQGLIQTVGFSAAENIGQRQRRREAKQKGRLPKSWTRASITTKMYCDFLLTISALRSLQLFPYGRWGVEFIPIVPELDFSKGKRSGEKHKPLWLHWI